MREKEIEPTSSTASNSSGKCGLDNIFGMVQNNDDLFNVMKKEEDQYDNMFHEEVHQRSLECVDQGVRRGYFSPSKLYSKLSKSGYDIVFNN